MLKDLLASENFEHIYIVARWFYNHGQQLIDNEFYDLIEDILKESGSEIPHLNHSWSEDIEPEVLLDLYDLSLVDDTSIGLTDLLKKYEHELIESGTISILPIRDYKRAHQWFEENCDVNLCMSIKIDGLNSKNLFARKLKQLLVSASRGRNGKELKDYTSGASRLFSHPLSLDNDTSGLAYITAYAEAYVDSEGVRMMKEFTGDEEKFVTRRSTALSVLTTNAPNEVYSHLHMPIFKIKNYGSSLSNTLKELKIKGYEVPYFETHIYNKMSYNDFVIWIDDILYRFKDIAEANDVPNDGMVVEVDSQVMFNLKESTPMYSSGNIALKIGPWKGKRYKAIVKGFKIGSELGPKENKSFRLIINPTKVDTGETVTIVNAYNLSYVKNLGILPGTEIYFVHQSQTIGVLEGVVYDD